MNSVIKSLESTGGWAPVLFLVLFGLASWLMIWRLEAMSKRGVQGTVLGTLVMPYCSGMGNLIFAFLLGTRGGKGEDVITNSIVNNVTNLTLVLGAAALIWSFDPRSSAKEKNGKRRKKSGKDSSTKEQKVNRLAVMLTLIAAAFFTAAVWALGRDRDIGFSDGLVLVGLFLFWQCFHVFEVLKSNVREGKSISWMLPVDLALLALGAYGLYVSTGWLVEWVNHSRLAFINATHLGWLSGWLMVLPNALLAFYYARRGNPEVVYSSQVADGHICIPLCIGIFALYRPAHLPPNFISGMILLLAAAALHFLFVATLGRLPRWAGAVLVGIYGVFLYKGLLS